MQTKIELYGAELPEGWVVENALGREDLIAIERHEPDAKFPGGIVTVSIHDRIFSGGECYPVRHAEQMGGGPCKYNGRGWKKRLIEDACKWLGKTMES